MLFQVGGEGNRPTFFEMAAATQLPASLRTALTYSLGVVAMRRPSVHRILDHDDEFFALLMLLLDSHSLRTTDASFSESLYGLRRRRAPRDPQDDDGPGPGLRLRRRHRILSLAFLVGLPYLRSKLHSIYATEREARLQATLWGRGRGSDDLDMDGTHTFFHPEQVPQSNYYMPHIKRRLVALVAASYPWIHATDQGLSFAYQLLYLLDATGFYNLGLHVLGIHVSRATGQELMETSSRISKIRSRERDRLRGPPWLKANQFSNWLIQHPGGLPWLMSDPRLGTTLVAVQRFLLNCTYTTLDYAQTGLIAAVFFFKMMEWWYQSAEERMSAPSVYPAPPPPPPPKVAEDGIPLPADRAICPLCTQKRVNPSVLAVSGYVYCYTCVFRYVSQYKRCPVTMLPATVEHVRRLFHDL